MLISLFFSVILTTSSSIVITFLFIYHPCNLLFPVNPFEFGPWNVVCQQCHKPKPPIYYSKDLPEICQGCITFDRIQADRALRQGNLEFLRDQLISEQDRRRNIEHELTQIKLQVYNILHCLLFLLLL